MRKLLLAMTAAATVLSFIAFVPGRADAMTAGSAAGVNAAIEDMSLVQDVATVCRHRYYSSRRVCWWRPGYSYRPWRYRRWRY